MSKALSSRGAEKMATTTGKIGFGTTSLLSLSGEKERQQVLHTAFEAGITHFDTAPYYGYGEAERILGRFIKERRDKVTITTKFGIQPPRVAGGGSVVAVVKKAVSHLPPLRKLLAKQAGKMVQRGAFGAGDAEQSLESSLRALQTDRIDVYLLHEADPSDVGDELLAFLQRKVREGVIGRFGTGSEAAKVAAMTSLCPAFADVLQFENSIVRPNLGLIASANSGRLAITHGALGASWRQLRDALAGNEQLRRSLSDALGADASDPVNLSAAMLAWAAQKNDQGTVLFSSSHPVNIYANMTSLHAGRFGADSIEAFARVAAHFFQPVQSS